MTNQPNRPKDLDMSDVHADARNMLEEELSDLDLPMIDIAVILLVVGNHLDIDPEKFISAYLAGGIELSDMKTAHGEKDIALMALLLDEALESSTQLPHILRALEIYKGLESL
jgi:hypothetical protein